MDRFRHIQTIVDLDYNTIYPLFAIAILFEIFVDHRVGSTQKVEQKPDYNAQQLMLMFI